MNNIGILDIVIVMACNESLILIMMFHKCFLWVALGASVGSH